MSASERGFAEWIRELDEDVIQGEYGYEPGEFNVFPEQWRPLWRKGLTPLEAWKRALQAFDEERKREHDEAKARWERIRKEDGHT